MALNKLKYNSLNVTPVANKAISFDSDPDALEATLSGGAMTFIKKLTASSDSTLNFVNGSSDVVLDSTYKEYLFLFKDIHPADDNVKFQVGFRDGSTAYDATKTSSVFQSLHNEGDSEAVVQYEGGLDLAQSTGAQALTTGIGNDNDQCGTGHLHLFNPSSTTFVKHYIARCNVYTNSDYSAEHYTAGYCNVTAAIDAVQFSMTSGNIDAGTITLYGIS
jgi:hypothetical protein